jgi:hypothetical protein
MLPVRAYGQPAASRQRHSSSAHKSLQSTRKCTSSLPPPETWATAAVEFAPSYATRNTPTEPCRLTGFPVNEVADSRSQFLGLTDESDPPYLPVADSREQRQLVTVDWPHTAGQRLQDNSHCSAHAQLRHVTTAAARERRAQNPLARLGHAGTRARGKVRSGGRRLFGKDEHSQLLL